MKMVIDGQLVEGEEKEYYMISISGEDIRYPFYASNLKEVLDHITQLFIDNNNQFGNRQISIWQEKVLQA